MFYSGVQLCVSLIIPNSIHTKSLFRNIHPSHSRQVLVLEAIHLDKTKLVIAQGQPLVAEIARADSVGVTAAGRSRVDEELALDFAGWAQFEGRDVAGDIEVVGAGGCEEVLAVAGAEANVAAVFVAGGEACLISVWRNYTRGRDLPSGNKG